MLKEGDTLFLVAKAFSWSGNTDFMKCNLRIVRANKSSAYAVNLDAPDDLRELRIKQSPRRVERGFNTFDDMLSTYYLYENEAEYAAIEERVKYRRLMIDEISALTKKASLAQLESALRAIKDVEE